MKNIIFGIFLLSSISASATLNLFNPNYQIKASEINQNFNHIKNIFQSKQVVIPFSIYTIGQVIEKETLEGDFSIVRNKGIEITPLSSEQIKSEELNQAFAQMLSGALSFDDVPVSNALTFSTNEDIVLIRAFSFTNNVGTSSIIIESQPTNGSVTVINDATFSYQPNLNYNGSDSFSYKVFDGSNYSNISNVNLTVIPVNDAPIALAQAVSTNEDTSKTITLSGSDIEGDVLTYAIVVAPTKGVISGTLPNITYTPNLNENGSDSFTFKVNDGGFDSNTATVSVAVIPVNDAPVADEQSISTNEDTAIAITLSGTDPENSPLSYSIASNPANGVLIGTGSSRTYTPDLNYNGSDSFTFKVNDGTTDSSTKTISITVNSINDAPVSQNSTINTEINLVMNSNLIATDIDNNPLTYFIVAVPTKGTVQLNSNGSFIYTPNLNQSGVDLFTFKVNDGTIDSATATVNVNIATVRNCQISLETGTQTWNFESNSWGNCLTASCISGQTVTSPATAICQPSSKTRIYYPLKLANSSYSLNSGSTTEHLVQLAKSASTSNSSVEFSGTLNLKHNLTEINTELVQFSGGTYSSTNYCDSVADSKMCMVRFTGNTILNGTHAPSFRKKGFVIYVDGDLTINGTISMTNRGANTLGQNISLVAGYNIGSAGGAGGTGVQYGTAHINNTTSGSAIWNPTQGGAAINGACGGGAAGPSHNFSGYTARGGNGAAGTSYSGGSGGGGATSRQCNSVGGNAQPNGGAGGTASGCWDWPASGGTGNPGGGLQSNNGYQVSGAAGTGGLLIIYVNGNVILNSSAVISSDGTGSYGGYGGGASGAGSVNLFHIGTRTGTGVVRAQGVNSSYRQSGNGTVISQQVSF